MSESRNKIPKIDHLTNAWTAMQRVRCGKPNCRCRKGGAHRAVYLFTRIDGKLFKRYVRKGDAERVRSLVLTA